MAKSRVKPVPHEEIVNSDHNQENPEAENETQDPREEATAADVDHDVDTSNKASLVRAALAEGLVKPREGCRWIKETYGVEVGGTYFSVAKSQQAKRSGEAPAPQSTSPAAYHNIGPGVPSTLGVPTGFGSDVRSIRGLLANHDNEADAVKDLIASVDTLVRKYGVSGLNEIIDAFSE